MSTYLYILCSMSAGSSLYLSSSKGFFSQLSGLRHGSWVFELRLLGN